MSSNHSNLRNHHSHYICEEHMDDFCDRLNYYLTGFRKSQNKVHNHIPERANLTNEERYLFVFKQIKRCIYSRFSDLHLQEDESFNKNENKNRKSHSTFLAPSKVESSMELSFQSYIQLINDYVNHLIQNPNDYWKHFTNQQYSTQIADEVKKIRNNTNVANKKRQPFYILTHIAVIYSLMKLYFLLEELCKRNFDISTIEIRFTRNKNYQIQYENVIKNVFNHQIKKM